MVPKLSLAALVLMVTLVGMFTPAMTPRAHAQANENSTFMFMNATTFAFPNLNMVQGYTPTLGTPVTCPGALSNAWTCTWSSDTFTTGQSMAAGTTNVHLYPENNVQIAPRLPATSAGAVPVITFRPAGAPVSVGNGAVPTPPLPAGWAANDIHILVVAQRDNCIITVPAGWTAMTGFPATSGTQHRAGIWWRRAVAGDVNPPIGNHTCTGHNTVVAQIMGFRGVDTTTAIDVANSATVSVADRNTEAANITTATEHSMLVFVSLSQGNYTVVGAPTGGAPVWAQAFVSTTTLGLDATIAAWYGVAAVPGYQNPLVSARSGGLNPIGISHGAQIALRPAKVGLTITKPTGTVLDDVMIASIAIRPDTSTITPPAGWALVGPNGRTDNANPWASSLAVYYKVATGTEPANYTWTFGTAVTAVGGIQSFVNVSTTSPIIAEDGQNTSTPASGFVHPTPSITTTVPYAMLVTSHGIPNPGPNAWVANPPGSMTEAFDPGVANGNMSMAAYYVIQAAAGATGPKQADSANADVGNAHIVALRPKTIVGVLTVQLLHNAAVIGSTTVNVSSPGVPALVTASFATTGVAFATNDRLHVKVIAAAAPLTVNARISFDGTSHQSRLVSPTLSAGCAAVANPTYVSAQAQSTQATIYWSSPTNANVVVLEKPTTAFAAEIPVNGTVYTVGNTIGAATVRYVGTASSFTRTTLANNTTYHYKVFPYTTPQACYGPGTSSVTARPAAAVNAAWSYMLAGGSALKPPTAGDDGIFFSSNSGQIISLDPVTGQHNWAPVDTTSATQGWLVPGTLSAGGSRVFTGDQGGKAYSVDSAAGGTPLWQPATGAVAVQAGPAVQFRTWADAAFTTAFPTTSTIAFAATASSSGLSVASLTYALTVPAGTDRVLIVSVQLGSNCAVVSPTVTGVTYATVALTKITTILGTPCGVATTRSEQWRLIAPAVGTANVVVTLSSTAASSVQSGAMTFTGVDQTTPVRAFNSASGVGTGSTVSVTSAVGDLVVNTVGQGCLINSSGQTQRFIRNTGCDTTLNNSGGSTAAGAAGSVAMTWAFGPADQWQTISSSLQPAAATAYDLVYVATKNGAATTNNKVYALRSDTGAVVWTFNDGTAGNNWSVGEINGTPFVDYERNRLYVTSLSTAGTGGSVWIVNTLTGRLVGTPGTCPNANTACVNLGNIDTAPNVSFDNDTLWVGNKVGAVYAITLSQVPGASMMKWTAALSLGATNQIKGLIWEDWDTAGRLYMVVANTTAANNTVRCFLDPGIGGTPNPATACSGWAAATVTINGAQAGLPLDQFYVTSWDGTTARIQQLDYAGGTPGTPFVIGDGLRQPGDLSTDLGNELFVGTTEGKIFKISLPIPP